MAIIIKRFLTIIGLIIFLSGCSIKPPSAGNGGILIVLADPMDRPIVSRSLEATFGRIIPTPQPEPLFKLLWEDGETIVDHTRNPLILLTASLDGQGPTADLLRRMLTPEVEEGVRSGDYIVFTRVDPWAKNQLLLILVGRNQQELGQRIELWADSLYNWAMEFERKRLTDQLFRKKEQITVEEDLTQRHGFRIRVQHDYLEAQDNDSLNFVRFIRYFPERWFMVAWGDMENAGELTPQFVYERRKTIGASFLDPVIHYDDRWMGERTRLGGRTAVIVRGLWATVGPTGGGPFFSYGVWIPEEKRYYIVDGAVFAPDKEKVPYLWQLETIVQTFRSPTDIIEEE